MTSFSSEDTSKRAPTRVIPWPLSMRGDSRESRNCSDSSASSNGSNSVCGQGETTANRVEIRIPWDEQGSLALINCLSYLGVDCRFQAEDGSGVLLISMDRQDDARVRTLWEALSDLEVRFIHAVQEEIASQLSFLEADGAPE